MRAQVAHAFSRLFSRQLHWTGGDQATISGINFRLTVQPSAYHSIKSTSSEFLVVKSREMIEMELATLQRANSNILEMGIWQGGSAVFMDLVARPAKLVAVDFSGEVAALSEYIRKRNRHDAVRPYYGVNQGDAAQLGVILAKEFPERDIDLIIDDASHFYEETKIAFNTTFPYLSPGGTYIIEDWAWCHQDESWRLEYFDGKLGVTNLLVQLMAVMARHPDMISDIRVLPSMAIITKGAAMQTSSTDIDGMALSRGQMIMPLL